MSLLSRLQDDMKLAMKAGEKDRLTVIRMLISDVKNIDLQPNKITEEQANTHPQGNLLTGCLGTQADPPMTLGRIERLLEPSMLIKALAAEQAVILRHQQPHVRSCLPEPDPLIERSQRVVDAVSVEIGRAEREIDARQARARLHEALQFGHRRGGLFEIEQSQTEVVANLVECRFECERVTVDLFAGRVTSDEGREGLRAFLEKRPAAWVEERR